MKHMIDSITTREILNEIAELEARGPEDALDGLYLAMLIAERNLRAAIEHKTKKSRLNTLKMRKRQAVHEYESARWPGLAKLLEEEEKDEMEGDGAESGRTG